jgi:hypothetical protein
MILPGRSVVAVLSGEHLQLQALSSELTESESTSDLVDVVTAAVTRHLSAEHRYFYPVVRTLLPEGERLIDHELHQDQVIVRRLASLRATPARSVREVCREIANDLRRHAHTAASQLLPRLQEMTTPEDQLALGDLIAEATRKAPTRPHPYTPDRPPWNRVLDPVVGAMDRLRDRASGRKTSPDQL